MNAFDLNKFRSNKPARNYVTARGKRFVVETLPSKTPAQGQRTAFKAQWVKLPDYWIERLDRSHGRAAESHPAPSMCARRLMRSC